MTLGDIILEAVQRDLASTDKNNQMVYEEYLTDDKFCIKFYSKKFPEASLECSVPYNGKEEEKNYCRLYFLSMALNTSVHGMKRFKHKSHKIKNKFIQN